MRNPTRTFFFHFLVSYLAVITINTAAYAVVYVRSARSVAEQAEESITLQLQRAGDLISARLEEIESGAYRIASDPDIVGFSRVRAPFNDRDYFSLLSIGGGFLRYGLKNSFVDSVYLIFRKSGAVFSTQYASPSFEWIYTHFATYNGMGYDDWAESIGLWSARKGLYPVSEIQMYRKTVNGLTYRVPIAMGGQEPKATLLAIIAKESILSHFAELTEHESYLEILDAEGTELFSAGPTYGEGARGIRVRVRDSASGLTFWAFVPNSYVAGRMQLFRAMFITVVIATLLAATLAASVFAFRTSRPLARLFGMIVGAGVVDPEQAHPDSAFLVDSMEHLIGERVDIERGIGQRRQLLVSGFYERLLRGGFLDADEVNEYLDSLGMTLPPPPWVVAVVVSPEKSNDSSHPVSEVLIHDYLEKRKPEPWHLHKTGEGDVLLLPGGPENVEAASGLLRQLHANLGLVTVGGHKGEHPLDILQILRQGAATENSLVDCHEVVLPLIDKRYSVERFWPSLRDCPFEQTGRGLRQLAVAGYPCSFQKVGHIWRERYLIENHQIIIHRAILYPCGLSVNSLTNLDAKTVGSRSGPSRQNRSRFLLVRGQPGSRHPTERALSVSH